MKLALPSGTLAHPPLIPSFSPYRGAAVGTNSSAAAQTGARMEVLAPHDHTATSPPGAYDHKHAPLYDRARRRVTPQAGALGQLIDIYI